MQVKTMVGEQPALSIHHPRIVITSRLNWVPLYRGLVAGLALLTITLFVLALPYRLAELRVIASTMPAAHMQLTLANALRLAHMGFSPAEYALVMLTIESGLMLAFALVSAVMLWHKGGDRFGLFIALAAITYAGYITPPLDSLLTLSSPLSWLSRVSQATGLWCAINFYYLFPDGRFALRWTRTMAVVCALWCLSWVLHPIPGLHPSNPFGLTLPALGIHLSWFVSGLVALWMRHRQTSDPVQRRQTKWVAASAAVVVVLYALLYAPPHIWPNLRGPGWCSFVFNLIIQPGYLATLYVVPFSVLFAILRYRLWDVDLLLNRALVYGVLTALLAGVYVVSVVGLPALFPVLTGYSSPVTISLATLITGSLVTPLRRRVQGYIDYRFFRRQYDAARTLAAFGATVRDEIDMDRLMDNLKAVIEETLAPVMVTCWVRHGQSYQHCQGLDGSEPDSIAENDPLIRWLGRLDGVIEVAEIGINSPGLAYLRRHRIDLLAPMVSHGELSGWLSLGARRSGAAYSASDRRLLITLAAQAAPALRVAQLVKEQQAAVITRERIAQELRLARTVQQTLLPKALPKLDGWSVATHFQPAREVGGDFYDLRPLANGNCVIIFGDVIGKGVPAALLMASTRGLVRSIAHQRAAPAAILSAVNELLHEEMPPGMFVTCFVGVLDPQSGRLCFANAGHTLPLLRSGSQTKEIRAVGMPLGLFADQHYDEVEVQLAPNDQLLFYSDGISEAHGPARAMYGTERMARLMARHRGDAAALITALLADLRTFTGSEQEQEDDVTLLVVERSLENEQTVYNGG